jgi:hypothetical protein
MIEKKRRVSRRVERRGRPPGRRNEGYAEKRAALSASVLASVLRHGPGVGLPTLASDAGVSIPTLKHYMGDRAGAIATALEGVRAASAPYVGSIRDPGELDLRASLAKVARDLVSAWTAHGVGRVFASGLAAGLFDLRVGPAYLDGVLEPTVLALEERLRVHTERGETNIAPGDAAALRTAALVFLSPLLVALLHQHALGGARCRPLEISAFVSDALDRFVRAYGARAS